MFSVKCISVAILVVAAAICSAQINDTISNSTDTVTVADSTGNDAAFANESISVETATEMVTEIKTEHANEVPTYADRRQCKDGLILPVWRPDINLTFGDRFARGLVYFLILCYLCLGISIVSDRFMRAIEKITASEKEIKIRKPDGTKHKVVIRVWNETVANLTLIAIGTSAPQILLPTIEIFSKHFVAGDLGLGTIVGSAAYNLFATVAICLAVIPKGEVRRIKHLRVFIVNTVWLLFAYIWVYSVLEVFSPGIVSVSEAFITCLCFPLVVIVAYMADRRLLAFKYIDRISKRGHELQREEANTAIELNGRSNSIKLDDGSEILPKDYTDFHQMRQEYVTILQELKRQHPQYDRNSLEMLAQEQLLNAGSKSHAFYRIQAIQKILGGGNVVRKIAERTQNEVKADLHQVDVSIDDFTPTIRFEPGHYTVMENCGSVNVRVMRRGDFSGHVSVDYQTEDGSAEAGTDYVAQCGTITFTPGIDERFIKIDIIDDDIFELDEAFYIRLSNPTNSAVLGTPKVATIMILDDDHGGFFAFATRNHELVETMGMYKLKVQRTSGARGKVKLPYSTEDGSAKAGEAYESQSGHLIFDNNETE